MPIARATRIATFAALVGALAWSGAAPAEEAPRERKPSGPVDLARVMMLGLGVSVRIAERTVGWDTFPDHGFPLDIVPVQLFFAIMRETFVTIDGTNVFRGYNAPWIDVCGLGHKYCAVCDEQIVVGEEVSLLMSNHKLFPNVWVHDRHLDFTDTIADAEVETGAGDADAVDEPRS